MDVWTIGIGLAALYFLNKKKQDAAAPQQSSGKPQVQSYTRPTTQASTPMDQFEAPQSQTVQTARPMTRMADDSLNGHGMDMRFPLRLSLFGW